MPYVKRSPPPTESDQLISLVKERLGPNVQRPPHLRRGRPRYPKEIKAAALKKYVAGYCAREVGTELGTSHQTVLTWVRAAGLPVRRQGNASMQLNVARMIALFQNGIPCTMIAKVFNVSPDVVVDRIKKAGFKLHQGPMPMNYRPTIDHSLTHDKTSKGGTIQ